LAVPTVFGDESFGFVDRQGFSAALVASVELDRKVTHVSDERRVRVRKRERELKRGSIKPIVES
jgi:hypothetical protein